MIENIHGNDYVLQQIEWNNILNILEKHSYFKSTLDQILILDPDKTERFYQKTQDFITGSENESYYQLVQALYLLNQGDQFNYYHKAISKHLALRLSEINQIANIIEIYCGHYKTFTDLNLNFQSSEDKNQFQQKIKKAFLKEFRQFVTAEGDINFEKHPKLRPLYLRQIEIEQGIRVSLTKMMSSSEVSSALQYTAFDVVNDRYVIPVRSDSYNNKMGQIISRSDTGHTLFVEPKGISRANFERLEIIIKIEEIVAKIELDIIKSLGDFSHEIKNCFYLIKSFDEYNTRAQFAIDLNLVKPTIVSEKLIDLKGFFHPLIENPVKNDFKLTEDHQGFIISGPNTGGKTATLKSLALVQLFLSYGLYLPAQKASISLYDNIFFFGNDQQNLEEGLSSFAAEVKNYVHLFEQLDGNNLILIDEIFNSTSSEEASALALAIFKKLGKVHNCHIVVSSHHQTLKTILHQDKSFISAHVGFQLDTNTPTYKIHIGSPGSSFALNIFKSMTRDKPELNSLFDDSIQFLDNKAIHYEKLLEQISQKENELNKLLNENREINDHIKNQKSSMEGVIKLKIDEKVNKAQKDIEKHIKKAQQLFDEIKSRKITKEKVIYNTAHDLKKRVAENSPFKEEYNPTTHTNLKDPREYIIGEKYFSLLLNKTVVLKKLNLRKNEGFVGAGNLTIKTPLNKLKLANASQEQIVSIPQGTIERSVDTSIEYDCRGQRLEIFQDTVHKAISNLLMGDVPFVNIIHGHGNGVLKSWLRNFLKNHNDLKIDTEETGNDGATRIILKA